MTDIHDVPPTTTPVTITVPGPAPAPSPPTGPVAAPGPYPDYTHTRTHTHVASGSRNTSRSTSTSTRRRGRSASLDTPSEGTRTCTPVESPSRTRVGTPVVGVAPLVTCCSSVVRCPSRRSREILVDECGVVARESGCVDEQRRQVELEDGRRVAMVECGCTYTVPSSLCGGVEEVSCQPTLRSHPPTPCKAELEEKHESSTSTRYDHFNSLSLSSSPSLAPCSASSPFQRARKNINATLTKHNLNPSLTLLNSGSVARDHLASERTFLAYVRTSMGVVAIGVALVQMLLMSAEKSSTSGSGASRLKGYVPALGGVIVSFGIVLLLIGFTRYFTVQNALTKGHFPAARVVIVGIATSSVVLVAVVGGFVLGGTR